MALVALATIVYGGYCLIRYAHLGAGGFDLGIFDQTVWHYSRFEAPANSVRGLENIWGDHFSPILALLAPLFWVWDDARMLLLAQALLLAAAAVPIFLYAGARLGRLPAYLFALGYLAFWGVQSALSFDFHELAFAPLLIALTLLAVERGRWGAYFALLIAVLAVKEDMSLLVVFLGIYVMTFGAVRQGAMTIALGVVWYLLVVKLLIPHYSPTGQYGYWSYRQFGGNPLSALAHAITHPGLVVHTLLDNATKTQTLKYLFVPLLGLMFFSRTVILLLPLVAERFLSTEPAYWNTGGHYTLAMAAILFIGAADGLGNLVRLASSPARPVLASAAAGIVLMLNVFFAASFTHGLKDLLRGGYYKTPSWAKDAKRALAAIPPDVSVATQDNLIARLAHRQLAAEISPHTGQTDYVAARIVDDGTGTVANGGFGAISRFVDARLNTHVPVAYVNNWLVLRARSLPPVPRARQLAPMSAADAARFEAARSGWMTAFGEYGREFASCLAKPQPRACVKALGVPFRARQAQLERELLRIRPGLKTGCLQLSVVAGAVAQVTAGTLEAARRAEAQGKAAELARHGAELRKLQAQDATGYITRFAVLCSPTDRT